MRNVRATLAGLALFVAAALFAWRSSEPTPEAPAPRPTAPSPAKVPPAAPSPEAPAPTVAEAPNPPVSEGFCTRDGEEQPVLIHHTLQRFLHEHARDPELDDATRSLVRSAFDVEAGTASDLMRRAQALRSEHGESALLAVVRAVAAQATGRVDVERESLRAAFRAAPDDPSIAWATADAFRHAPDIALATRALTSYLRQVKDAPSLVRLAARLEVERDIERDYRSVERDGVALLFPPDSLAAADAEQLLSTVVSELDEASRLVGTERRPALTVVVYPGREEILAVTCVKSWAAAMYDGSLRVALENGKVDRRVLRHETLHAALSPTAPKAPQWFDEGVAQYFAHEDELVQRRWSLMVKNRSWIPFASLDGTFQIFDAHDDVALAYAQSLAMVEWLVDRRGPSAISVATALFRDGSDTTRVLSNVLGTGVVSGDDLLDFLGKRVPPSP